MLALLSNATFWSSDGFHELYVEGSSDLHKELLVIDSHQLLFAYGHLSLIEELLKKKGFAAENPLPLQNHIHIAHPSSKDDRLQLLKSRDWNFVESSKSARRFKVKPLQWLETLKYLLAMFRFTKKDRD